MTVREGRIRGAVCVLLLALLAVCGYAGSGGRETRMVSVDVTRQTLSVDTQDSAQDAAARLAMQREEELSLLQGVIDSEDAGAQTREDARAQLMQLVRRMEIEAQSTACLAQMGYEDAAAMCGAQLLSLFIPYVNINGEEDTARIVDVVCGVSGFEPGDVKIILTKK